MTWNIHKGLGGIDRRYNLERTIEVLGHYDPDILLLQEVAQGVPELHRQHQANLLQQALGLHSLFHPEHRYRIGSYGNLILSRWPLYNPIHLDLTIGRLKRRGMIQAHIRVQLEKRPRSLVVHNFHLGLIGRERHLQLERFGACPAFQGLRSSESAIVGGDLNDLWGTLGKRFFVPARFERAGPLANTFPSALPLRPLDGLFFRGPLKLLHSGLGQSNLARTASDHLPLFADFELLPA